MTKSKTIFEKIWDIHTVDLPDNENCLIYIDRCYLHDLSGPIALKKLKDAGLAPFSKELVFASPDHTLSSKPNRCYSDTFAGKSFIPIFREECKRHDIELFDMGHPKQGIIHVIGPELGLSLPGITAVCGDSHTCTHGAVGALAWGVGTSELYHVLATQTLMVKKPKTLRVKIEGSTKSQIEPMDIILSIIARYGTDFGIGYAVEYSGSVIRNMEMEGRFTICNLTVEFGSEYGIISPDDVTYEYFANKEYAPKGKDFERFVAHCQALATEDDAEFDKEILIDISELRPQISWGISPSHTMGVDESIPDPADAPSPSVKTAWEKALEYMDLKPGQKIEGLPIDRVFIGSCTNGRISNLQSVANIVKGRKVAPNIEAWIVPGSVKVKNEAEKQGLDIIFKDAGFLWGEPGCSLCGGSNGETVSPGKRCISTTNRNFIGRQGRNARTHLASPSMAAAAAIAGKVVDVRKLMNGN